MDISKIRIDGVDYNLKDEVGRNTLATKQKKLVAGDGITITDDGVISCSSSQSSTMTLDKTVTGTAVGHCTTRPVTLNYTGNGYLISQANRDDWTISASFGGGVSSITFDEPLEDTGENYCFVNGTESDRPGEGTYNLAIIGDICLTRR